MTWPKVAQNTIGEQILRAGDSVAANIVEGGYRDGDRDALRFFIIARGSAGETAYFLRRAIKRKLLPEVEGNRIHDEWNAATQLLNNLIKYRRSRLRKVKEPDAHYGADGVMNPLT